MNKISLIIQREYTTRVKKKSFIVMTILTPVLMASLIFGSGYLATREDNQTKIIAVIDKTNITEGAIPSTAYMKFVYLTGTEVETVKSNFASSGYYAILYIPENLLISNRVQLYSNQQTTVAVNEHIVKALDAFFTNIKLKNENVPLDILKRIATNINVDTIQWTSTGEEKSGSAEMVLAIGYISGFLMYMFIFMFGAQVMRGVMEEKTNRIVEVIISSVKPFQMMMGKVVGIALVGLTQFLIWIALTFGIFYGGKFLLLQKSADGSSSSIATSLMEKAGNGMANQAITPATTGKYEEMFSKISKKFSAVNFPLILGCFLFYFIGGYLLYASLFASVGSAVDNDTDTQQFMLPITIPILVGLFVMMNAMQSPNSSLAVIFSIIPLTSPIVMMARIPYEIPYWQLGLSAALLVLTFMGTIWMAGKIYRTGILMYGKKVNYAELWKWIKYKN